MTNRRGFFGRMAGAVMALVGIGPAASEALSGCSFDNKRGILMFTNKPITRVGFSPKWSRTLTQGDKVLKVHAYVVTDGKDFSYVTAAQDDFLIKTGSIKTEWRLPCG